LFDHALRSFCSGLAPFYGAFSSCILQIAQDYRVGHELKGDSYEHFCWYNDGICSLVLEDHSFCAAGDSLSKLSDLSSPVASAGPYDLPSLEISKPGICETHSVLHSSLSHGLRHELPILSNFASNVQYIYCATKAARDALSKKRNAGKNR